MLSPLRALSNIRMASSAIGAGAPAGTLVNLSLYTSRGLATSTSSSSFKTPEGALFLGLDSSTQGLKVTAVDSKLNVVKAFAINYQKDLPHFNLVNGVHAKAGNVVTQPTLMYFEALDLLLNRMKAESFPFSKVAAVSGSGQQHGSVYWKTGARETLKKLVPGASLKSQLSGSFRIPDSPIWMDSSTTAQCQALEKAVGGAQAVATITGSRAYERFTGNQIAKIASHDAKAFAETERISLISSAMCSVLLGDYAPIDTSDGCGMNMLDLKSYKWSSSIMPHMGANTEAKLGPVVPSHTVVGNLSKYFVDTYGMPANCKIVAWSGDNPNSVAGTGLRAPGDIAISLGTSDTMFGITASPTPGVEGHIFANPVDPKSYMAMLCYKNGSLTRERIRNEAAAGSWETFDRMLTKDTKPGNGGRIGFYIDNPEITPSLKEGVRRFAPTSDGAAHKKVASFPAAADARAVVEGQFLSLRLHGESVGLKNPKRVIATGGASGNAAIAQVLSDVFGAPVFVASQTDSASLGAAYRALHGWIVADTKAFVPFEQVTGSAISASLRLAASPNAEAHAIYTKMLPAYKACEAEVLKE